MLSAIVNEYQWIMLLVQSMEQWSWWEANSIPAFLCDLNIYRSDHNPNLD